jgi:hypothetical protein
MHLLFIRALVDVTYSFSFRSSMIAMPCNDHTIVEHATDEPTTRGQGGRLHDCSMAGKSRVVHCIEPLGMWLGHIVRTEKWGIVTVLIVADSMV